ncbi:MAG: DUF4271 domain-containing protein [Muribaculaceae bacterium]|nr:DUF4271 domain-containing protein [Muribaculaceae bacterium]
MVQEGEVALTLAPTPHEDSYSVSDSDSVTAAEPVYGIILTPPPPSEVTPLRQQDSLGVSFILSGMFLLFLTIALRFHNNIKYAVKMFRNIVETRTRQNIFDDTVRETSLIVLLNILWCVCVGIIGYSIYQFQFPSEMTFHHRSIGMLWGMAVAVVYSLFMWWAYSGVGWVFSDKSHSELWVKGFASSQALMTPALFITSLLSICRPETAIGAGVASAIVFILVKLVFIWKGYRIFFSQFSSWVLFLCYLCSLEIVPLILCYRCALFLGKEF